MRIATVWASAHSRLVYDSHILQQKIIRELYEFVFSSAALQIMLCFVNNLCVFK